MKHNRANPAPRWRARLSWMLVIALGLGGCHLREPGTQGQRPRLVAPAGAPLPAGLDAITFGMTRQQACDILRPRHPDLRLREGVDCDAFRYKVAGQPKVLQLYYSGRDTIVEASYGFDKVQGFIE